jgi:dienelactone hydrolase
MDVSAPRHNREMPRPPGRHPAVALAALLGVLVLLAGAGACQAGRAGTVDRAAAGAATEAAAVTPAPVPAPHGAPTTAFEVGVRTLRWARTADRKLPTTVFYPKGAGRFPVVIFSHGLNGRPSDYRELLTRWAAAGFVVAAPAYPHTTRGAARFDALDVVNQPADASYVLTKVLALNTKNGDPLRGHLDTARVAAAGHSAGGITTVGLFSLGRDDRLTAGIVLAGNGLGMGKAYAGRPASLLFVHGDKDPIVPYDWGRAAYDAVPWPKAWLRLRGQGHIDPYLRPGASAFAAVNRTTTDFLRWTLYGDATAKRRLAADAKTNDAGRLDNRL